MKILYIANIRIPTEKAHGYQIMKMCEAFSLGGMEVELVVPWRFNKIHDDPFDFYQVKRCFKIRKLFSIDLMPLMLPRICFWIQSLTFVMYMLFYIFFHKVDIIYSRDWLLLALLRKTSSKLI